MMRVLIIGAGDVGEKIVREMQTHSTSSYTPIGFIDDEKSKLGKRIHGIKVLGTREDLCRILHAHKPEEVLLALPGTSSAILREITTVLEPFNIRIKTLPNLQDILHGKVQISQIRDLAVEDLLQRAPVGLNPQRVRSLIEGKRIFVTGAGGSIGSELCRQIAEFHPQGLILYERYENSLYAIHHELADRKCPFLLRAVVGDVTDTARVVNTLKEFRPHIIFHAAAHKHVPLMEMNPGEALKNNVLGSRTMAEAAEQCGVDLFVLISTDKAVNPSSVMGATKRAAELLIQNMAHRGGRTCYLTVRFGNVLGSNGSVVPRFQEQIKAGGPVTILIQMFNGILCSFRKRCIWFCRPLRLVREGPPMFSIWENRLSCSTWPTISLDFRVLCRTEIFPFRLLVSVLEKSLKRNLLVTVKVSSNQR